MSGFFFLPHLSDLTSFHICTGCVSCSIHTFICSLPLSYADAESSVRRDWFLTLGFFEITHSRCCEWESNRRSRRSVFHHAHSCVVMMSLINCSFRWCSHLCISLSSNCWHTTELKSSISDISFFPSRTTYSKLFVIPLQCFSHYKSSMEEIKADDQ